jgi:hypothetical protein
LARRETTIACARFIAGSDLFFLLSLLPPSVELPLESVSGWKHNDAPRSKRHTKTGHDSGFPAVRTMFASRRQSADNGDSTESNTH